MGAEAETEAYGSLSPRSGGRGGVGAEAETEAYGSLSPRSGGRGGVGAEAETEAYGSLSPRSGGRVGVGGSAVAVNDHVNVNVNVNVSVNFRLQGGGLQSPTAISGMRMLRPAVDWRAPLPSGSWRAASSR